MLLDDIETLEGIGRAHGARLRSVGIACPLDLRVKRRDWPRALDAGVPPGRLARWIRMAELARVADMTPNLAEALLDAGITNVEKLSEAGLRTLEKAQEAALGARRSTEERSRYALADLIREAWRARSTALVHGTLRMPSGEPLEAATVVRGWLRVRPRAADGRFVLRAVPVPDASVSFEVDDVRLLTRTLHLTAGAIEDLGILRLDPMAAKDAPRLREGRGLRLPPPASGHGRHTITLDEAEEGRVFVYRQTLGSGKVRLLALDRTLRGTRMILTRLEVPRDALDDAALDRDSLFRVEKGALTRLPLGRREFEMARYRGTLGFEPPQGEARA